MSEFPAVFELSSLDGSNGFKINGVSANDYAGFSVSSAGDLNGDGFADLIVGAPAISFGSASAEAYVVFGKASGFGATLDLSSLDGSNGFRIAAVNARDETGYSVSSAGDVNGDGFDDLIVSAPSTAGYAGASFVVFGKTSGFGATLALSGLDGSNGFRLDGVASHDNSGVSVSTAGDVNGDGIDDLIVGASGAYSGAGASYVVFGSKTLGASGELALSGLDGSNGFRIDGVAAHDVSGRTVSSAGDLNGDGIDDLIIGAEKASPNGLYSGASYVVFGTRTVGSSGALELSSLDGVNGFRIDGAAAHDYSGNDVSSAGDLNGDGFADVIVSSPRADTVYVVFGGNTLGASGVLELSSLDGSNGFRIGGLVLTTGSGHVVSSAGDVNGDGFADLIVGSNGAGPSYVVFGKASGFAADLEVSSLDGDNGFKIDDTSSDHGGSSVSAGGDVNGDGFADLIVGAPGRGGPVGDAGAAYVIYGHASDEPGTLEGTDVGNTIHDGNFSDRLLGRGGDDLLFGAGGGDRLNGGDGDDVLHGGDANDTLISGKGTDALFGEDGRDTFNMGKWLRADDSLDGGAGFDTLRLNGDYSFGLRFAPTTMVNIEEIKLRDGFSYDLRFDDANVAAGARLIVSGFKLTGSNTVSIDGSKETDGSFKLGGGAGNDHLIGGAQVDTLLGGAGDDVLQGGAGADVLTGGPGSDTFVYRMVSDSVSGAVDHISDFDASSDSIDLWFNLGGLDATQTVSNLNALPTVFDAAHLGQHHAALAEVGTHTYLVIDANGVAGYQAGADLLIRVDGITGTLTTANFV